MRFSEKTPPVRGEHADAVRVPRSAGAENRLPRKGEPRSHGSGHRKVCATPISSLEKRTPISSPDVFYVQYRKMRYTYFI